MEILNDSVEKIQINLENNNISEFIIPENPINFDQTNDSIIIFHCTNARYLILNTIDQLAPDLCAYVKEVISKLGISDLKISDNINCDVFADKIYIKEGQTIESKHIIILPKTIIIFCYKLNFDPNILKNVINLHQDNNRCSISFAIYHILSIIFDRLEITQKEKNEKLRALSGKIQSKFFGQQSISLLDDFDSPDFLWDKYSVDLSIKRSNEFIKIIEILDRDMQICQIPKPQNLQILKSKTELFKFEVNDIYDKYINLYNDAHIRINNEISKRMIYLTLFSFAFIITNSITSLWGMNVRVPGDDDLTYNTFWGLFSTIFGVYLLILIPLFWMYYKNKK